MNRDSTDAAKPVNEQTPATGEDWASSVPTPQQREQAVETTAAVPPESASSPPEPPAPTPDPPVALPPAAASEPAAAVPAAESEPAAAELRGSGIVVSSFAPAGIDTEMITLSGQDARFGSRSVFYGTPERIGAAAVRSWKRCRVRRVGGPGAHAIALLGRIMPRALVRLAAERIYRPPQQ